MNATDFTVDDELLEKIAGELALSESPTLDGLFDQRGAPRPLLLFDPTIGELGESRLMSLMEYWAELPRIDDLPAAARLDPVDIASVLAIVMLLEPVHGKNDYRYLVYGEEIAKRFTRNMVGALTSEIPIPANVKALFLGGYLAAIRHRKPLLTEHTAPPTVSVTKWRRLILPLAGPDGTVTRILVGNIPGDWRKPVDGAK